MDLLKRSSSSNIMRRQNSQTNHVSSRISHNSPDWEGRFNSHALQQYKRQTIQAIFQNKNVSNLKKISARVQLRNKKQILGNTEQRIFSEVLGLMNEIDEIKNNIRNTHQQIKQLAIAYPQIEQKVQYYGYDHKLTIQQCSQLEQQNERLASLIKGTQQSKVGSLQDVLKIEQEKYDTMKKQLSENKLSDSKTIEDKIKSLKQSISELQHDRNDKIQMNYPQFNEIKQQNEILRQATLANLIHNKDLKSQQQQIMQYLKSDQQNRQQFMRELQSWKKQYKRIKTQNQTLKLKLIKRDKIEKKENINDNLFRSKASNKMLEIDSQIKKNSFDRLGEYESLIKRMKSLNK